MVQDTPLSGALELAFVYEELWHAIFGEPYVQHAISKCKLFYCRCECYVCRIMHVWSSVIAAALAFQSSYL